VTESQGVPSVSVLTSAFTGAAQARAAALGMPDVRLVILPSPLASRSVADVQRLAHTYAPEIVGLLSTSASGGPIRGC
jgi:hypothetical protein